MRGKSSNRRSKGENRAVVKSIVAAPGSGCWEYEKIIGNLFTRKWPEGLGNILKDICFCFCFVMGL